MSKGFLKYYTNLFSLYYAKIILSIINFKLN